MWSCIPAHAPPPQGALYLYRRLVLLATVYLLANFEMPSLKYMYIKLFRQTDTGAIAEPRNHIVLRPKTVAAGRF